MDDEVTLVDCRVTARHGVPFGIGLTSRRLTYLRIVSFRLHNSVALSVPLSSISDVWLGQRWTWPLIVAGVVSLASALPAAMMGWPVRAILLAFFGVALLASARRRRVLSWREGRKRRKIVQPVSTNRAARQAMHAALETVAHYLTQPAALGTEVARLRELAIVAPPEPLDDRRLCSDGACIGIIGADDRCKACGTPAPRPLR